MSVPRNCCFCGLGDENEVEYGKLHSSKDISVHYYCLLFSSGLAQNGDDDEGVLGFLVDDIWKEVQRGKKLSCCYCLRKGATIGCYNKKCRKTYHYPCGLKQSGLFKFANDFRSYCSLHREYQKGCGVGEELECPICMEELIADPKKAVWAPCCQRKTWFHKLCLQKLALSAGYFFKCPLCNDKDVFQLEMQNLGIYVPEKDASWELEPNAFSELLERPIHCDAPRCKCPEGRKTDEDGTRWEILLCNLCGSTGVHIACGGLPFICTEWNCQMCVNMLAESVKRTQQEDRERRLNERKNRLASTDDNDHICSSDSPQGDASLDITGAGCSNTPGKRKRDDDERGFETPSKMRHLESIETSVITYASDSDEEVDIDSGEFLVPPHTIIRELEENGEELPKKLLKLKNFAMRAQERMQELRLTEADIVKIAKESSKDIAIDKSQVTRFFRYKLPLEKMLQIADLIKKVFAFREAMVLEAQSASSKKKGSEVTPSRRRRRSGTPNIKIPFLKTAISQSVIASGLSPSSKKLMEVVKESEELDRLFPLKDFLQANTEMVSQPDVEQESKCTNLLTPSSQNTIVKSDNESDDLNLFMTPISETSSQSLIVKGTKEMTMNKENEGFSTDDPQTPVACRKLLLSTSKQAEKKEFGLNDNDDAASGLIGRSPSSERSARKVLGQWQMKVEAAPEPSTDISKTCLPTSDVIQGFLEMEESGLEDLDYDEVLKSNVDSVPDLQDDNFGEVMMALLGLSPEFKARDGSLWNSPGSGVSDFDGFPDMPKPAEETHGVKMKSLADMLELSPKITLKGQIADSRSDSPSKPAPPEHREASPGTTDEPTQRKTPSWKKGLRRGLWGWYRIGSLGDEEDEEEDIILSKHSLDIKEECFVVLQCLPTLSSTWKIQVIDENTIKIYRGGVTSFFTLKNPAKRKTNT